MEQEENKKETEKQKKVVFSKEIDSSITGYAIGISFLAVGVFLLMKPDYFYIPIISYIFGALIGLFGMIGTSIELSKSVKIQGTDSLIIGLIFFSVWLVLYLKVESIWLNVLSFFLLVFGCFLLLQGLIQSVYSIILNAKNRKNEENAQHKGGVVSQLILLLTQLSGLALAIVNVIKAVNV